MNPLVTNLGSKSPKMCLLTFLLSFMYLRVGIWEVKSNQFFIPEIESQQPNWHYGRGFFCSENEYNTSSYTWVGRYTHAWIQHACHQSIFFRTVSSQYICLTGWNCLMGRLDLATSTIHLIFAITSQDWIECTVGPR